MSYLGIDIGTSGCKAVVFSATGQQLSSARRSYAVLTPRPGWAELSSSRVLDACCEVIAEAAAQAPSADPLRALGISSQGEAFTPVGGKGEILGNGLVSSDCRALAQVAPFVAAFGLERLYQLTGHTPSPMFSLFKLLWLKEHQPELWSAARSFLCYEDLLSQRLGVEAAMGWPLAGRTMLFDVEKHCWSSEILDAIELPADKLARPLASGSIAGSVSDAVAAELGLPRGVLVVTGGHDQTIAALGAGVIEPGMAMYAAGTVECLCPVLPALTRHETLCRHNLCCYDYSIPGAYSSVAYSLTGSNLLQYCHEQFGGGQSYDEMLAAMPAAPSELLVLPYFTPSGTPYFDPHTPGSVWGWRLGMSAGEVLKGLLEGVALEMKLNLALLEQSGMAISHLVATGGGSRNAALVQMKANVLNKAIQCLEVDEAGCLGAARLAQSAVEERPVQDLARQQFDPARLLLPDAEQAAAYERKFQQYQDWYACVRDFSQGQMSLRHSLSE
jgi:xylulokinase